MSVISVQITCGRPHWVTIDDLDVPLHNGHTTVDLQSGPHALVWAIIGTPGDTFKAVLSDGGHQVCNVNWSIPAGSSGWTGDFNAFTV
jgi:hypothetical protein